MVQLFKLRLMRASVRFIVVCIVALISIIPLRLMSALYQVPEPQAVLVLGGNHDRILFAAQFARNHPKLDVWVSDYQKFQKFNRPVFLRAGIAKERMHYDVCAIDTVTNFTCTVKKFEEQNLRHLYLVTSDYHMRRAIAIATLVFGSRGIVVTPVAVPSQDEQPESLARVLRDSIRSLLWILIGQTGASFNKN